MSFDSTVTEYDLDATAQQFVQGFRDAPRELEADLAVDGLSDSILSRILDLFGVGPS